jgi:hypothetical protein
MSERSSSAKFGDRGSTFRNDWVYSLDGGCPGEVPIDAAPSPKTGDQLGEPIATGGDRDVTKAPWFTPVDSSEALEDSEIIQDCPGGVCTVPWLISDQTQKKEIDVVNHPPHYTAGGSIECIEAIEAQQTLEEFRGYLKGCIAKYLWRERHKGGIESLEKANWYLERLIELDKAQNG